jgi:hypothetical protein
MRKRISRIVRETGLLGLLIRTPLRVIAESSEGARALVRHILGRIPLAWLTPAHLRARLARNAQLRQRHAGQQCFILGNGPSLRQQDLSPLRDQILMTCNQGYLFAEAAGLRATYHAIIDPIFLSSTYAPCLDELAQSSRRGTCLLTTIEIADALRVRGAEQDLFEIHQFLISDEATPPIDRLADPTEAQLGFLSVIHMAIATAMFMGFKDIVLLGCDMDFFVDPEKPMRHSYEERFGEDSKTASQLFGWDQVDLMAWCLREFRGFDALRKTAEVHGIQIVNAGVGGALNVYVRRALPDVLASSTTSLKGLGA